MRNKWTWILFSLGTTIGTWMFMSCQGPDASGIVKLPKGAHVVRIDEQGFGGEAWIEIPNESMEDALAEVGAMNHMVRDSDSRWTKPEDPSEAGIEAYVEIKGSQLHAVRKVTIQTPQMPQF